MKTGDMIHGFKLKYSQPLPEIKAVLHRFTYEKNGADTIWLERDDDNKSFAITFRTVPEDDTGVFHILEHSVLNGSEKYPLREPFVDLLKSSLATFLNAMTAPDMTIYPVSSRNDKDFLNLIDVYMDAVLHPLSLKDPHSFRQEGWHYELESPEGELTVNGVVFNEMKGSYTSSDNLIRDNLNRLLFPDTCYGKDSGGDPDHIPELTYEQYKRNHRRFYHPSNSYIFVDGKVDLDSVFAKLDSFLCEYDRIDPDSEIALQAPVAPEEKTICYPIGPEDDEAGKALIGKGWVYGTFDEIQKNLAVTVLNEVLAGSNEAPLTKALLDAGLCEDVSLERSQGGKQSYVMLIVKNCDPADKQKIWDTVDAVFAQQLKEGLNRKRLGSVLSHIEFLNREKDFGGLSKGLVYGLNSMDSWLYGGDPADALCSEKLFKPLREMIDEGGFEKLLKEIYIDGGHKASIVMLPSKTIAAEKREQERQRLAKLKETWSKEQIETVIDDFKHLRVRQNTPDTPEQIATLPRLSISDIPEKRTPVPLAVSKLDGVTVLHQAVDAGGISYVRLNFSLNDLDDEELSRASILATLMGSVETENYSVTELDSEIDEKLGRLSVYVQIHSGRGGFEPLITMAIAVLEDHKDDAVRLADEILNRTRFSDEKYILNLLRQHRIEMEQSAMMRGNAFAARRASAKLNEVGVVREDLQGMRKLRLLQKEEKNFGADSLKWMSALMKKLFSRDRLTLSLTGDMDEKWLKKLISVLPSVPMGDRAKHAPLEKCAEGFLIPSEIGFAARSALLSYPDKGALKVASQFLSLDYLWNTIRVKGGAYGTSFAATDSGTMEITSYRDPNAAQSLDSFMKTADALSAFAAGEDDLSQYVVSTIGNIDPLRTPRSIGPEADWMYFSHTAQEELDQEW
ncbi:MAG: insulinase family protein, partial [Clostridia bacterium]|nr:insulinase family protein [Clostridia bacterium]